LTITDVTLGTRKFLLTLWKVFLDMCGVIKVQGARKLHTDKGKVRMIFLETLMPLGMAGLALLIRHRRKVDLRAMMLAVTGRASQLSLRLLRWKLHTSQSEF
jgi:hypothetical protein